MGIPLEQYREEFDLLKEEAKSYRQIEDTHNRECKYKGCRFTGLNSRVAEHVLVEHYGHKALCHACGKTLSRLDSLNRHRKSDGSEEGQCQTCAVCKTEHVSGSVRMYYEARCTGKCILE